MRFSQRLELRQGQSLVMTPQLLQAIKLLQFSSIELVNYVDAELERNPLLERAEEPDGPVERTADAFEAADAPSGETEWAPAEMAPERGEIDDRQDTSFDNVFP